MEILLFHFNLIPLLLFVFLFFTFVRKWEKMISRSKKRLPPGPWKLPLIGSMHHLIGALPHHAFRNLAIKYGPLMHLQLGEIQAVIVSSPYMAKQVLKIHDLSFATRTTPMAADIVFYNCKDIVFAKSSDYWKCMRKICISELLGPKMVKSFSLIRQDEAHNLVTSIRSTPNTIVDMTELVVRLSNSGICRSAFGKVWEDRDDLLMIMRELLALLAGLDIADLFPSWKVLHKMSGSRNKLMNMHKKIDVILEKIINEHKQNKAHGRKGNGEFGGEDLIDVLLRVMENDELPFPMTNDNIKAVILDVFLGGTETSATTILWAFSEMMKKPNVMAKAQEEVRKAFKGRRVFNENDLEELKYLKLVIKETLRLHPPAPFLAPRECTKETEIDGYVIPLKTRVIVNSWAIGRDPESWDDPENFVPERFKSSCVDFNGYHYQFIPFGAGSRTCPGMQYGLAFVMYPLAQLLYHFDWKLPNGIHPEDLDMTETIGITTTRQNHLHLIATPHDLSHYLRKL